MKKADIKPGVVYAIWNRNSDYDIPEPVVFLNAPAAGELYTEARYPGASVRTCFRRDVTATKPRRSSWNISSTGYPAVRLDTSRRERGAAEDLLRFTLADFEAATSAYGKGYRFTLITSLGQIAGPWDEVKAEHDARRQAQNERRAREDAARERSHARAAAIIATLGDFGIKATSASPYGHAGHIQITLDEAEKLAALLRPRRLNR